MLESSVAPSSEQFIMLSSSSSRMSIVWCMMDAELEDG